MERSVKLMCAVWTLILAATWFFLSTWVGAQDNTAAQKLSGTTEKPPFRNISVTQMEEIIRTRLSKREKSLLSLPLKSSPEIEKWAKQQVQDVPDDPVERAKQLHHIIFNRCGPAQRKEIAMLPVTHPLTVQEVYEKSIKRGAEVYGEGRAYLFVVACRALKIDAVAAEVIVDLDGSRMGDDDNFYVCAAIFVGDQVKIVDPAYPDFEATHQDYRLLTDLEATAFHNASKGLRLFDKDDQDETALEYAQIATKLDPNCFLGHIVVGLHYDAIGNLRKAEEAFQTALRLRPKCSFAKIALAGPVGRLKRYDEAVELTRKAFEENPRHIYLRARANFVHGAALFNQGKVEESIKYLEEAVRLNPTNTYYRAILMQVKGM
ncbi:MAG: tetratricopeptide repeat protein [Abditibacteriales bacterium]|nr:tetratricopeptide repeat protein [Abditibacteriales bacterium]